MTTQSYEDRLKATIEKFRDDALANLRAGSESEKERVEKYVTDLLAGLSVEFPLSLKGILDKGGAVRQVYVKGYDYLDVQGRDVRMRDGYQAYARQVRAPEVQGEYQRLTIIWEPVEKADSPWRNEKDR